MSLKKFIFFIIDIDGKSYSVINGIVSATNLPKQLLHAPDGNQEIAIGWERSPVYDGNIRNFSLPLGFVMDGATILRHFFYTYNLDIRRFLLVKRLTYENTTTTYKEYYKQLYKGELDFSTSNDDQGEFRFNINIMEGGLQKQLKANEGTDYELPFDGDAKNLLMDGMYIKGLFRWTLPAATILPDKYLGMFLLPNDNPIPGLAVFEIFQSEAAVPDSNTTEYFAQFTQDIPDVHFTGLIVSMDYLFDDIEIRLIVFNTFTDAVRLDVNLTPVIPVEGSNLVIDETLDLLAGDRLFLKMDISSPNFVIFEESTFNLEAKSKPLDSTIKGFTLADVGRKLVEKMTGSADNFESDYLDGINILLTSGDGVRGITNASVKTSWRNWYKAVDTYAKTQMTIIDNKIKIFAKETAYDSTQTPIALGEEIKNFKCTDATDQRATSIKVGHMEQQVDDTNGKFDFNGWMVFTTPIKAIADKQYDLQSPYKASPYEIEQTRANYEGKTTTDKDTDNNIFAIAAVPDVYSDSFDTLGSFFADGMPLAPGEPLISIVDGNPPIIAGMKLRITGTALNDQDVTVKSATGWFFGQLIAVGSYSLFGR